MAIYKYIGHMEVPVDGFVVADTEHDAREAAEEEMRRSHDGYVGNCEVEECEDENDRPCESA